MYKIEQHGKISLRRPKLSKEEVKRLMKKKGVCVCVGFVMCVCMCGFLMCGCVCMYGFCNVCVFVWVL